MKILNFRSGTKYAVFQEIRKLDDMGFVVVGTTIAEDRTDQNIYIAKLSTTGIEEWSRIVGGEEDDTGQAVEKTLDGGYIIVGNTKSFGEGVVDIYLIRTDEHGDIIWDKTFGGPLLDSGFDVGQVSDSGYVAVGGHAPGSSGDIDIYVIKTDQNGGIAE